MTNVSRARKAYSEFTGHTPAKVTRAKLDGKNVAGWKMGPVVGIAYEARRDGKTTQYFHEFKKSARPDLVSKDDGSQLYINGGRYKVTDRGIEDMPALFVVNPSPRAGKSKRKAAPMARRRKSVRRRRATRQVAVFRANPIRRRRRRASVARPARRRSSVRRFARNPAPRRRRSARAGLGGAVNFGKMILPAVGIGAGAVISEVIMGYLPIPANFKTGVLRHVTKGVVGIAAGMAIGKILKQKRLGNFVALGAVAIAAHDAIKEVITARMPSVPFGAYLPRSSVGGALGYYSPGSTVEMSSMGQYLNTAPGGLGESPDFQA